MANKLIAFLSKYNIHINELKEAEYDEFDSEFIFAFKELLNNIKLYIQSLEIHKIVKEITYFIRNILNPIFIESNKAILFDKTHDLKKKMSTFKLIYYLSINLTKIMSPILSFSMESIWITLIENNIVNEKSVFLFEIDNKFFEREEQFSTNEYKNMITNVLENLNQDNIMEIINKYKPAIKEKAKFIEQIKQINFRKK